MVEAVYSRPTTIEQALALMAKARGEYLFIAGGTDVQTYRKQELEQRQNLIDLSEIASLKRVTVEKDQLLVGALTTLDELARSKEANAWCPMIIEAARAVASPTIRYTATVGGNLLVSNRCTFYNQSKLWRESAGSCLRETGPTCLATGGTDKCYARNVSDLATAFVALDATVEVCDKNGSRLRPLIELYLPDGLRAQGGLEPGAIVTGIRISLRPTRWFFRKLRQRESIDFTSLTVAGALTDSSVTRICINGISTMPVLIEWQRSQGTLPELQILVRRACKTVDNDLIPLKYRREMIDIYLEDLWSELVGE